jgi:hypothetical protein
MHQKDNMQSILEQLSMKDYNPTQTPLLDGFKLEKEKASDPIDPTIFHLIIAKLIYLTNIC